MYTLVLRTIVTKIFHLFVQKSALGLTNYPKKRFPSALTTLTKKMHSGYSGMKNNSMTF